MVLCILYLMRQNTIKTNSTSNKFLLISTTINTQYRKYKLFLSFQIEMLRINQLNILNEQLSVIVAIITILMVCCSNQFIIH